MIVVITFDWIEDRYIDNLGNMYKTIEEIPKDIRHLVINPTKPHCGEWVKGKMARRYYLK